MRIKNDVTLRLQGSIWYYDFRINGKRSKGSTGKKVQEEAQRFANEIRASRIVDSEFGFDRYKEPASILIDAYYDEKKSQNKAEGTLRHYRIWRENFLKFFQDIPLPSIGSQRIREWRQWLTQKKVKCNGANNKESVWYEKTYSIKVIRNHIMWLSALYKHYDLPNPCKKVELPKESDAERQDKVKYLNEKEIGNLLKAANDRSRECSHWFSFLVRTGLRIGEARRIKYGDLDVEKMTLKVYGDKMKKYRTLPLRSQTNFEENTTTTHAAKAWLDLSNIENMAKGRLGKEQLEAEDKLTERSESWFYGNLKIIGSKIGRPDIHPHMLRHSFASMVLMSQKLDIALLSKWLGHEDIAMTMKKYAHFMPSKTLDIELF